MPKILYATVLLACVVISRPVHAQQSLVLNVGHFAVRGIDTRVADDVLLENLNLFAFDILISTTAPSALNGWSVLATTSTSVSVLGFISERF